MPQAKRNVRLPKKNIYRWFYRHYGYLGMENYTEEMNREILKAIKTILENTGLIELDFIGKVFIKLSGNPYLCEEFLKELEDLGF